MKSMTPTCPSAWTSYHSLPLSSVASCSSSFSLLSSQEGPGHLMRIFGSVETTTGIHNHNMRGSLELVNRKHVFHSDQKPKRQVLPKMLTMLAYCVVTKCATESIITLEHLMLKLIYVCSNLRDSCCDYLHYYVRKANKRLTF